MLERREVMTPQIVVPNSPLISDLLARHYPAARLSAPVPPGVEPGEARPARRPPPEGGVIGFVGKEWKRKNLAWAISVAERLAATRPGIRLRIYGPEPSEIGALLSSAGIDCAAMGWKGRPDYASMDLLIHPARSEPYGMVVAEALASRVPVVISDRCGIAPYLKADMGEVLDLEESLDAWAAACERQLCRDESPSPLVRRWEDVTDDYEKIYLELEKP